jgi:hypothetical protein
MDLHGLSLSFTLKAASGGVDAARDGLISLLSASV